jgi:hypothetical protein
MSLDRKKKIKEWAAKNIKKWPGPFDTFQIDPDPSDIGARWAYDPLISTLPFLRCNLGGCWAVTSDDWFYARIKYR